MGPAGRQEQEPGPAPNLDAEQPAARLTSRESSAWDDMLYRVSQARIHAATSSDTKARTPSPPAPPDEAPATPAVAEPSAEEPGPEQVDDDASEEPDEETLAEVTDGDDASDHDESPAEETVDREVADQKAADHDDPAVQAVAAATAVAASAAAAEAVDERTPAVNDTTDDDAVPDKPAEEAPAEVTDDGDASDEQAPAAETVEDAPTEEQSDEPVAEALVDGQTPADKAAVPPVPEPAVRAAPVSRPAAAARPPARAPVARPLAPAPTTPAPVTVAQPRPQPRRITTVLTTLLALVIIGLFSWRLTASGSSNAEPQSSAPVQTHAPAPASASASASASPPSALDTAAGQLAGWLRSDVDPAARVVLSRRVTTLVQKDKGGAPPQPLTPADQIKGNDYDLIVVAAGDPVSAADTLASSGQPVARFGPLDVRQVSAKGPTATTTADDDRKQRSTAGRELIRNDALSFSVAAKKRLRAGEVDPRMLALLASVAAEGTATVQLRCDEVADPGTPSCRTAELPVVGGQVVTSAEQATPILRPLLDATSSGQPTNPRVSLVRTTNASLLRITFLLPVPTGLLGDGAFPTP